MKKDTRSVPALKAAERLYKRKPDAETAEFRKVCERADKAIRKLDNRQFNAQYVLPLRRSTALRKKGGSRRRAARREPARTRKSRRAATSSAQQRVARLLRRRDADLLKAAGDSFAVYEIAAGVDEFAAEIVKAVAK